MTPLTEKRFMKVLEGANHRFRWYVENYRAKSISQPKEASKRWWEALKRGCSKYDFSTLDVDKKLLQIGADYHKETGISDADLYDAWIGVIKHHDPTAWDIDPINMGIIGALHYRANWLKNRS